MAPQVSPQGHLCCVGNPRTLVNPWKSPPFAIRVIVVPTVVIGVTPINPDVLEPLNLAFLDALGMTIHVDHRGNL